MPKPIKEPVLKECLACKAEFLTKYPERAKYCPGSKCRSKAWDEEHRVASPQDVLRKYWREEKRRWRRKRREAAAEKGATANA